LYGRGRQDARVGNASTSREAIRRNGTHTTTIEKFVNTEYSHRVSRFKRVYSKATAKLISLVIATNISTNLIDV